MTGSRPVPADREGPPPDIDTSVAHVARVYDYWLGGKDNFAADREAGDRVRPSRPDMRYRVRANRAFLARTVRFLAAEAGIRQFLDIGTGLPTADNTHEVAQAIAPGRPGRLRGQRPDRADPCPRPADQHARGRHRTTSTPTCATRSTILAPRPQTLDFSQPVALMLIAILQSSPRRGHPARSSQLMDALPSGSYLAISHPAATSTSSA